MSRAKKMIPAGMVLAVLGTLSASGVAASSRHAGHAPGAAMAMMPHAPALDPTVHTSVSVPVAGCWCPWTCCCYSGDMKATFAVTLNGDGTAEVKTTLKLVKVKGPCGDLTGAGSTTQTVAIGPAGAGVLLYQGGGLVAQLGASFTVNGDGTVSGVGSSLIIYVINDP